MIITGNRIRFEFADVVRALVDYAEAAEVLHPAPGRRDYELRVAFPRYDPDPNRQNVEMIIEDAADPETVTGEPDLRTVSEWGRPIDVIVKTGSVRRGPVES